MSTLHSFDVISYVVTGLFLIYVVCGFLLGVKRGLVKASLRLGTLLFSAVLALLLLRAFSFENLKILEKVQGLIKNEAFDETVNSVLETKNGEQIAMFVTSIVKMLLGGVFFMLLYFVLKSLTLIVYSIVARIITRISKGRESSRESFEDAEDIQADYDYYSEGEDYGDYSNELYERPRENAKKTRKTKNAKKGGALNRLLGGFVGVLCGILTFSAISVPISGYIQTLKAVDKAVERHTDESFMEGALSSAVKAYESSLPVKISSALSLDGLKMDLFDYMTTVKYDKKEISLYGQAKSIGEIVSAVQTLSDYDYSLLINGATQEYIDEFSDAVITVLSNDLVKAGASLILPLVTDYAKQEIEIENQEIMQTVVLLIDDVAESVDRLSNAKIKSGINCVFSAISKVNEMGDKENIEAQDLIFIGEKIDEVIEIGLVGEKSVQSMVGVVVDEVFKDESLKEMPGVYENVRGNIQNGIVSYKTEMQAIAKIFDIDGIVSDGFDIETEGEQIGLIMDETIAIGSNLVNAELMGIIISNCVDEFVGEVEEGSPLHECIKDLGARFKIQSGQLNYQTEFKAMAKLYSAVDVVEDFDYSIHSKQLGKIIDETLEINAKVINKSAINSFIEKQVVAEINTEKEFGDIVDTVTHRLSREFSYEQEFGYLQELLYISDNCEGVDITNLNKKISWPDRMYYCSMAQRLDEIAPSVLFGDCGLNFIGEAIESYNTENPQFSEITYQIINNYNEIKQNARVCGSQQGYTYCNVADSIVNVYNSLSDSVQKITGQTTFTSALALRYERTLDSLQTEIIVGTNGAKAIARYVAGEIKQIILSYKTGYDFIDDHIDALAAYVNTYQSYLSEVLTDGYQQPYVSTQNTFAVSKNGSFEVQYYQPSSGSFVKTNKPFSTIFEKLEDILN